MSDSASPPSPVALEFFSETPDWKLDAFIRWTPKTHTGKCTRCGGRGKTGGHFADPDEAQSCESCRGSGTVTHYPETPMPEVPPALTAHMGKAWKEFMQQHSLSQVVKGTPAAAVRHLELPLPKPLSDADLELLTLAAKAIGRVFALNGDNRPGYVAASNGDWRYGWCYWNPLTNYADALDLTMRLRLRLETATSGGNRVIAMRPRPELDYCAESFTNDEDLPQATCKAITRIAAVIGRNAPVPAIR